MQATIVVNGLDHPEDLAFAADGSLWTGGEEGQIYVVPLTGGTPREIARTGGSSLGMAFDRAGAAYVCNLDNRIYRVEPDGAWRVFADRAGSQPMTTPNYPVFGPDGSLYVSGSGGYPAWSGQIYRFDPDGRGTIFHPGPFKYANGLAIDATGAWLYVIQTGGNDIVRLRLADGAGATPEIWAVGLEHLPDGLAFDSEGNAYVTAFASDAIYKVTPVGHVSLLLRDVTAQTLNRPTNCAFGGPTFDRLYVANLGSHFISAIDIGSAGQPLYGGYRGEG